MAAVSNTTKQNRIRETIRQYGDQYYGAQELTHVANEIIKDGTQEKCNEMLKYLADFPYQKFGTLHMQPCTGSVSMAANDMKLAMSEVMSIINEA